MSTYVWLRVDDGCTGPGKAQILWSGILGSGITIFTIFLITEREPELVDYLTETSRLDREIRGHALNLGVVRSLLAVE
jgi:hypothetical protein